MKKSAIIAITLVTLILGGGIIVGWSVYNRNQHEGQESFVKTFTDENFDVEVVQASRKRPVILDFYADWCFPCRLLEPTLEDIAREMRDRVVVGKLNTDKNMMARRFGVTRIPAVFIIRDGEVKESFFGVVSKETLSNALKE
ncbi:MAG: thioredoxin 1 [Thermodesulfobacteriota bacterium]|nr:thioredoxin 1 [Thermodesulfobacteriota bacterium]